MILDIKPFHGYGYNCYEDSVATVASWWGRDHQMMFADAWNFYFSHIDSEFSIRLGDKIEIKESDQLKYLEQYHGIKSIFYSNITAEDAIDIVKMELSANRPILLLIDVFFCPWDLNYQKSHDTHCILITGLDDYNSKFYCTDGIYTKQNVHLYIELFMQGYRGCFTFELIDNYNNIDGRKYIESVFLNLQGDSKNLNTFESIRKFANEMEKKLDFKVEMEGYMYFEQTPIFLNIRKISRGRKKFSSVLKYLGELYKIEDLLILSEKMSLLGSKWSIVEGMITKGYITSNLAKILCSIVHKIRELADYEEDVANSLAALSKKWNEKQGYLTDFHLMNDLQEYYLNKEIEYIELRNYMNNNGFGSSLSIKCTANLTGTGYYFLTKGLPEEKVWQIEEMKFNFPDLCDGINDNIACKGENIKISAGNYHSIMLLGCAEDGDFNDSIIVEYADGKFEEVSIKFSDWAGRPLFNETVAWQGQVAKKDGNAVQLFDKFKPRLFAKAYILKHDGISISIRLPDCPNIHIFAISLCKK